MRLTDDNLNSANFSHLRRSVASKIWLDPEFS